MADFDYYCPTDPFKDEALRDAMVQSLIFPAANWETYLRRLGPENMRGLRQAGHTIGSLAAYRTGHWFGGQQVSMGGIAAVGIVPEARGGGAGAELMTGILRELHEDGIALSTLFATTQQLYRKVGYELAGTRHLYELPLSALPRAQRRLPLTPVDMSDPSVFFALNDRRAARTAGHLLRTAGLWERLTTVPDHTVYGYLLGPDDEPEGYVIYHQPTDWTPPRRLTIRDVVTETSAAMETFWGMIHDHRSIIDSVRWYGPANDPLLMGTAEGAFEVIDPEFWMTRIVNVTAALQERGYPDAINAELHLDVKGDDILPANNARLVLSVSGGRAEVTTGGEGHLAVDIATLAPLFTGLFPATQLAIAGRLSGPADTLLTADQVFAGPEPWMPEGF